MEILTNEFLTPFPVFNTLARVCVCTALFIHVFNLLSILVFGSFLMIATIFPQ